MIPSPHNKSGRIRFCIRSWDWPSFGLVKSAVVRVKLQKSHHINILYTTDKKFSRQLPLIPSYFRCYEKQVTMATERYFYISAVWRCRRPRFGIEVTADLKSNFCVWLLGSISCHGNRMKVSISAILRHRKLKFGTQIPLDLRNEFFWLLSGFGYHGNTRSLTLSATVEHWMFKLCL